MPRHDEPPVTLNAALRAKYDEIRRLLDFADLDEIRWRHRIGSIIAQVRDGRQRYGRAAVERMAAALELDDGTLYRYAAVADLWSEDELTRTRNFRGRPLSWRHWIELSKSPVWKVWLDRTLALGWSARRLAQEMASAAKDAPFGVDVETASDTTRLALLETVKSVRRFQADVARSFDPALDRLSRAPAAHRSPEVRELLDTAFELFLDAHARTAQLLDRVRELDPAPAMPPVQVVRGRHDPSPLRVQKH